MLILAHFKGFNYEKIVDFSDYRRGDFDAVRR